MFLKKRQFKSIIMHNVVNALRTVKCVFLIGVHYNLAVHYTFDGINYKSVKDRLL